MESAFNYCPWCGCAEEKTDLASLVESVFAQVEVIQATHACSRISRIESELGELEKELSLLIAGEHTL
jgi:hypothetical protein